MLITIDGQQNIITLRINPEPILINPKTMKVITLLNITLIALTAVTAADIILTIYNSGEPDYTGLIAPATAWLSLFLIRIIYNSRQKTLDQMQSVRVNKL